MTKDFLRLCFCLLFVTVCGLSIQAQSGRRQPAPPPSAPIPTPTPEPTPVSQTKVDDKSELGFVVAIDRNSSFSGYPYSFYDAVQSSCANRLREGSSAWVEVVRDGMTRADALKRAKAETSGSVVWLDLSTNSLGRSSDGSYNDIEIEYLVLAPGTAKIVTSGRGYQNSMRKGPIVLPKGTGTAIYREEMLAIAAEQVADRILKAMRVGKAR